MIHGLEKLNRDRKKTLWLEVARSGPLINPSAEDSL